MVSLIVQLSLISCLLKLSAEDLKQKYLNQNTLLIYTAVGLAAAFLRFRHIDLLEILDYGVWGLALVFIRQKLISEIGEGDLWVLAGLPLFLPAISMWETILCSFFLMFPIAGCVFAKEKNKKIDLPYLPALCGGTIMTLGKECLKWFL